MQETKLETVLRPKHTNHKVATRIAIWSTAHPWRAITSWLVFVVLCIMVGSMIGNKSATGADYRVGEAGRAESMAAAAGRQVQAVERVFITSPTGTLNMSSAHAAIQAITQRMQALPEVTSVAAPTQSKDGNAIVIAVTMRGDKTAAGHHIAPLLAQTTAIQAKYPSLKIAETGDGSISHGTDVQRGNDLLLSEEITLPVTLIILLVIFGAVFAAGVPLVLALSSIGAAMGLAGLASHVFPDAGVAAEVIIMIGLAVGIDYSLFYVKRVREERDRAKGDLDYATAVEVAAATSGHAILVSGVAVAISTICLYLANDVIFSSLATGTIIVVLVAMTSSLTILPALLVKLGRWIDHPRVPLLNRFSNRTGRPRLWAAMLRPAMRHPLLTLTAAVVIMAGLALPALHLTLGEQGKDTFSDAIPAVKTFHQLTAAFPSEAASHLLVVRNDSANPSQVRAALNMLVSRTENDRLFGAKGTASIETSADGRLTTLKLPIPYDASTPTAKQSLQELRTQLLPATIGKVPGVAYAVTGDVARNVDYIASQKQQLPLVVGLLLFVTFIMMFLAFRSIVIGLFSIALNLLSAAAAFGVLVFVFQGQWAQSLLGFTSTGFIGSRVPLFLFVVLFGLSMDYQVFVVSRVKEATLRGLSLRDAVFEGIASSASVVTSAAVVMTSVFVSFIFLHLLEIKQIGFGLAIAVLLDAFIVRIMILPSLMLLLGKSTWWPSRTGRRP